MSPLGCTTQCYNSMYPLVLILTSVLNPTTYFSSPPPTFSGNDQFVLYIVHVFWY